MIKAARTFNPAPYRQNLTKEAVAISTKASLSIYTFSHFCVDFGCFFILFSSFVPGAASLRAATLGLFCYNVIAFGAQPVVGALCDAHPRFPAAPLGCLLLLAALALGPLRWAALLVCAAGNALFHVGGGIDALVHARSRMGRSGVFVSSGALGVALGTLAAARGAGFLWLPLVLAAAGLGLCLLAWLRPPGGKTAPRPLARFGTAAGIGAVAVVLLCFISIAVRAWVGGLVPMPWRTGPWLQLLPAVAAFGGKMAGGFVADRLGAKTVGVVSLMLALPLLCAGYGHPATAALGLFFFNLTMPLTLCAVADALPRSPGLSFGLTTLALLCGTLPLFFFALPAFSPIGLASIMAAAVLLSAVCLLFGLANRPPLKPVDKS